MRRTTIMIPDDLKARAERRARRTGTSLGGLVRESLEAALRGSPPVEEDPFWTDEAVFDGSTPKDLAARHDVYLYGDEP